MIPNHKGEIPFVTLLIPFIAGIILAHNFGAFASTSALITLLFTFSILFITLNITYKRFRIYKHRWLGGALISLILIIFGLISYTRHSELNDPNHFSKTPSAYLLIKVNNEPILKNGYLRFIANVEETITDHKPTTTTGTLLISLKDSSAQLKYGDELLIRSKYSPIDPPFNPAEFNYKQYLAGQNIYYQHFLFPHQYAITAHNKSNAIIAYALAQRQYLVQKLKQGIHNPQAAAIASSLLLGYRADLSPDLLQTYSQTGTIYVLTVSGAQLAVIYFLLNYLLSFISRRKYGKVLRAVIIISVLWYYALLTGFSPAICRAVVVASLMITGKTFDRHINSLNLLAVSAFALLLYNPYYITEVGFQLGYIAVAGLIIFRPVIYQWFTFKNPLADKLWNLCAISIAAQAVTFPLTIYYFHQFPVYFLATNLLVVIPVAIIMYAGLLYLLLPSVSFISAALAYLIENIILIMNKILSFIQQLKFANINKLWINNFELILLFIMITSFFYFLHDRKAWLLKTCLICLLIFSINISYDKINQQQSNTLTFLDLRKHTGIVMISGTKAIVITDLPNTDKNYQYSVQPYLDSTGVRQVQVFTPTQNLRTAFAAKQYNLLQFRHTRILICNGQHQFAYIDSFFKPNYVYMNANPYAALNTFNGKQVQPKLVVDGSNSDHFISTLDTLKLKYTLLKRNKSFILVSN